MEKSVAIIGTRGYPSYYGGFETLIRQLAPYLADQGWDVTVYGRPGAVNLDDPGLDERIERVVTHGIESKSLSTLSYGLTSSIHAAMKKPDVALVLNVANGYWLPILKARGIPTIVNVDGIEWEREKWGRFAKAAFRIGANLTARFANDIVCDSLEIRRRWGEEFDRLGVFIPYGGVVPQALSPVLGLQRRTYVLMVARFVPENTVWEFLEAAEELSKHHDVVIVGSSGYGGEMDARVSALERRSPRIKWLGHVSDDSLLQSLWQNAGVYFHGHSVGGTNPALVQAMACGAPIVARDTAYNREVLGGAGWLTAPEPKQIASTIRLALSDTGIMQKKSNEAQCRAKSEYSWESVCASYDRALRTSISVRQDVNDEVG